MHNFSQYMTAVLMVDLTSHFTEMPTWLSLILVLGLTVSYIADAVPNEDK